MEVQHNMKKEGETLLGHVGVDSGQLIVMDPGYIDGNWKGEEMDLTEVLEHPDGTEETVVRASKRWFELIEDINEGKIKIKQITKEPKHNLSYNAVCQQTLSNKGYGSIPYAKGHEGLAVVFSSGIGDGFYPVYGKIEEIEGMGKRITEVRIDMTEHPLIETEEVTEEI